MNNRSSVSVIPETETEIIPQAHKTDSIFYSEDWTQRKIFVIAAFPYFDIMTDREYLYLIRLGKFFYWSTLGTIAGLLIFSLVGAIIGYYMGSANDKKKRALQRSFWMDANHKLTSKMYEKHLFLRIPMKQVRSCVVFEKHKMIITHNNQKLTFAKKS